MTDREVELAKMESGKIPLPVGVYKIGKNSKGYRLQRTFKCKKFQLGTFQSLEHAVRVNAQIGKFVDHIREVTSDNLALELQVKLDSTQRLLDAANEELRHRGERIEKLTKSNKHLTNSLMEAVDEKIQFRIENENLKNRSFFSRLLNRGN